MEIRLINKLYYIKPNEKSQVKQMNFKEKEFTLTIYSITLGNVDSKITLLSSEETMLRFTF